MECIFDHVEISNYGPVDVTWEGKTGEFSLSLGDLTVQMDKNEAKQIFDELAQCLAVALRGDEGKKLFERVKECFDDVAAEREQERPSRERIC